MVLHDQKQGAKVCGPLREEERMVHCNTVPFETIYFVRASDRPYNYLTAAETRTQSSDQK